MAAVGQRGEGGGDGAVEECEGPVGGEGGGVGGVGVGVAEAWYVPTRWFDAHATGVVAVLSAESCDGVVC